MPVPEPSITTARRYIDLLLARGKVELPPIPPQCAIIYVADIIEQMKTLFPYSSLTLGITNPMQIYFFTPEHGPQFLVARGLHGAPMAAVQLEELIALGCDDFLVIGPAGHPTSQLQPDVPLGALVVATKAWIYEGTSPHYGCVEHSLPSDGAVERLKSVLHGLDLEFQQGAVATTDALYRETKSLLQHVLMRQGLAVEMELSALCTVAKYHGKTLAGLLFISDVVNLDSHWEFMLSPKIYHAVVHQLTSVVQEYMGQM